MPDRVIAEDQAGKYVLVVNKDNVVEQRRVTLGQLLVGGLRVIATGLTADDRVVLTTNGRAIPGGKVVPKETTIATPPAAAIPAAAHRPAPPAATPPACAASSRAACRPDQVTGPDSPMISAFFINRPVLANVLAIVIVLIGGVALATLPIAQYPNIVPPTVQVTTTYPGASAKTVVDNVALPIELQVNGVEGMIYMQSTAPTPAPTR